MAKSKTKDGNATATSSATALPDTAVPVAQPIISYKGFDKNLQCRGFQYEFGKTYDNGGKPVVRCGDGAFHSCEMPVDILSYYPPIDGNRFGTTTPDGQIAREENSDTKIASAKITINAEVSLGDLGKAAVKWGLALAKQAGQFVSGIGGHGVAAGDYGHGVAAGIGGHASVGGKSSVAAALGVDGTATAVEDSAIVLAAYDTNDYPYKLIGVRGSMVGENGVEAGKKYRLTRDLQFEEVVG